MEFYSFGVRSFAVMFCFVDSIFFCPIFWTVPIFFFVSSFRCNFPIFNQIWMMYVKYVDGFASVSVSLLIDMYFRTTDGNRLPFRLDRLAFYFDNHTSDVWYTKRILYASTYIIIIEWHMQLPVISILFPSHCDPKCNIFPYELPLYVHVQCYTVRYVHIQRT